MTAVPGRPQSQQVLLNCDLSNTTQTVKKHILCEILHYDEYDEIGLAPNRMERGSVNRNGGERGVEG